MSAVIGQSGALVAKMLQRPGQRLLGCSRQQYLRFRAQQTSFSSPVQRSFAWTAKSTNRRLRRIKAPILI
ncbi:hypothetical protein M433DRAFT_109535 [Acidomyces richmondensis BFW]|nr:MAG: hypothetical protein FE78DRAFT_188846 [Acidomyces sp. 'richmondensis']KYG44744.1 hypothetical protein M433DRAFT_109535 [Acidomyces richmondensis BFW]